MSSKLFEEAVADAKKLRYVAEENAKKAILEAVTPRIREFIEGQLMEDDHEDDSNESISSNIEEASTTQSIVSFIASLHRFANTSSSIVSFVLLFCILITCQILFVLLPKKVLR